MKLLVPLLEVVGVFLCANHFWPKGVIHGEHEEWEKDYRHKARGFPESSSKSSQQSKSRRSSRGSHQKLEHREKDVEKDVRLRSHGHRREIEGRRVIEQARVDERDVYGGRGALMYDPRSSNASREVKGHRSVEIRKHEHGDRDRRGSVAGSVYGTDH